MSLITRNAKECRSMLYNKYHKINLSGPCGDFLSYSILTPSHTCGRELIQKRHHYQTIPCVSDQANRDFFWYTDCIFQLQVLFYIYARATRMPFRVFARNYLHWNDSNCFMQLQPQNLVDAHPTTILVH